MARAAVYDKPRMNRAAPKPTASASDGSDTSDPGAPIPPRPPNGESEQRRADGYTDKIAKYVPAEVLAFYLVATYHFGDDRALVYATFCLGLIGTVLYLWASTLALRLLDKDKPYPFFYIIAASAFCAWAMGTSPVTAEAFGIDYQYAAFALTGAVFLLPGIDYVLDETMKKRARATVQRST